MNNEKYADNIAGLPHPFNFNVLEGTLLTSAFQYLLKRNFIITAEEMISGEEADSKLNRTKNTVHTFAHLTSENKVLKLIDLDNKSPSIYGNSEEVKNIFNIYFDTTLPLQKYGSWSLQHFKLKENKENIMLSFKAYDLEDNFSKGDHLKKLLDLQIFLYKERFLPVRKKEKLVIGCAGGMSRTVFFASMMRAALMLKDYELSSLTDDKIIKVLRGEAEKLLVERFNGFKSAFKNESFRELADDVTLRAYIWLLYDEDLIRQYQSEYPAEFAKRVVETFSHLPQCKKFIDDTIETNNMHNAQEIIDFYNNFCGTILKCVVVPHIKTLIREERLVDMENDAKVEMASCVFAGSAQAVLSITSSDTEQENDLRREVCPEISRYR